MYQYSVEFFHSERQAREWIDRNHHLHKIDVYSDEPGSGTVKKYRAQALEHADFFGRTDEWLLNHHACVLFIH